MKKVVKVIEMKLFSQGPGEEGYQISFVDYKPETEKVDPRMDKFRVLVEQMQDKLPKDVKNLMEGLVSMGNIMEASAPTSYFPQGWFFISKKEHEELGRPMVGDLLALEVSKTELS